METFGVLNYITYVVGCILIVLLPGPNSLYVLTLSAQQGIRAGWAAAAGIFAGDALLMIATALGAVSLLRTYPSLFILIKYIGAAYLAFIGFKMIKGAFDTWKKKTPEEITKTATLKKTAPAAAFKKALLVSLLNPKALLFFFSFFVQFVDPNYPAPSTPFLILGLTLQLFSFVYLATLIRAGYQLAEAFRRRQKLSAVSSGSVGAVFIGFATQLALASL